MHELTIQPSEGSGPSSIDAEAGGVQEYVYLIGCAESALVKIGRSEDVSRRRTEIQRMSPVPLTVLWSHPGGAELETRLHRCFGHLRSHGEWFHFGEEDPIACVQKVVETGTWSPPTQTGDLAHIRADSWWEYVEHVTNRATQAAIANATGVDKVTVWRWRAERATPKPEVAIRLARAYGRPVLEALAASGAITYEEASVTEVVVERGISDIGDEDLLAEMRRRVAGVAQ
ncbi:GIY-YIG nuclease family protein [Microbispora rosea]|uniref:GIY-YIG nuclease family protein n=1 Tax=Microbispora rosea TaxID=58117 RepID=UPI00068D17D5|nr:GIY-YIG nuclease family protein [Microbispora rosea]